MKIINSIEDLYGIVNNNDTIQKVVENDTANKIEFYHGNCSP